MTKPGPRDRLLARLEAAWSELNDAFADLSPEQRQRPGVVGNWSVRDLLAHITVWEEEALTHLPLIAQGGRPPKYSDTYGGIDAFNAQNEARWRKKSLAEIERDFADTHRRLSDYLNSVPDELLMSGTRFRRRLQLDAIGHYEIHSAHIREWRSRLDGSNSQG